MHLENHAFIAEDKSEEEEIDRCILFQFFKRTHSKN